MRSIGAAVAYIVLLAAGSAFACGIGDPLTGIPDLDQSIVSWGLGAGTSATLLVVPDGSGAPLTAARLPDGTQVDATVHLQLRDWCGDPIANFPREDIWLGTAGGGIVVCAGGTAADRNTDLEGNTLWAQPLRAGGHSRTLTHVIVNGSALAVPGLALHFVSPDLNADRMVSLIDVAAFAAAYFGAYTFAADFHADGVVNLNDITVLARAMGAHCP